MSATAETAPVDTPEVSLDTPSTDESWMDSVESFEMGEDGQLHAIYAEEPEGDTPAEPEQTTEPAPAEEPEPEPARAPETPPPSDWEQRYKHLQPAFTKASQRASDLEKELNALRAELQKVKAGNPDDDPLEILADRDRAQAWLDQQVDARVASRLESELGRYQRHFIQLEIGAELNEAATRYSDFHQLAPQVLEVLKMDEFGDLNGGAGPTIDQAYRIAKRLAPTGEPSPASTPPPSGTPAPTSGPSSRVPMEELRGRAARLTTETGVGASSMEPEPKKEADSVEEAFQQALAEARGQRRV